MAAFLWGVFPYLAISCLVIGSVWRRVTRPLGWSAKSAVVWTGTAMTIGYNAGFGPYEYRTTVGPWLRSVLALHPDVARMSGVPGLLQLHVILSFALFAATPFTRLVHVWSAPLRYPARSPILYRTRRHPSTGA